jgi:hypothetical protein
MTGQSFPVKDWASRLCRRSSLSRQKYTRARTPFNAQEDLGHLLARLDLRLDLRLVVLDVVSNLISNSNSSLFRSTSALACLLITTLHGIGWNELDQARSTLFECISAI